MVSPVSINATQGIPAILEFVNTTTEGWFASLLLIGIWFIITSAWYKSQDDMAGALAVSGFGTWVFALLMWAGGWVSGTIFGIVTGVAIVSVIIILVDKGK